MKEMEWIVLNYTLPKEPSRVRVSVWRKLKKQGSVNIGQSMWILPCGEETIRCFNNIAEDIRQNSGEAYVMRASFLQNKSDDEIITAFHQARNEEYTEVLEKCEDFFQEIEKETSRENFTYAEIEENEYEYNKLVEWYRDIVKRDFFHADLKSVSEEKLNRCKEELDEFSKKIYDRNDEIGRN
jgi:DNA-binding transcriptional regulator PaaX